MRLAIENGGVMLYDVPTCSPSQLKVTMPFSSLDNYRELLPDVWRVLTKQLLGLADGSTPLEIGLANRALTLALQVDALGGDPEHSLSWKPYERVPDEYVQKLAMLKGIPTLPKKGIPALPKKGADLPGGADLDLPTDVRVTLQPQQRQQRTLMKWDPATGTRRPYPSEAAQWRDYHGHTTAWLFNPWTGSRRRAEDVGSDVCGHLIIPPNEAVVADPADDDDDDGPAPVRPRAAKINVEHRYRDLLNRLGVQGHDGAIVEITNLRRNAGLK